MTTSKDGEDLTKNKDLTNNLAFNSGFTRMAEPNPYSMFVAKKERAFKKNPAKRSSKDKQYKPDSINECSEP